MRDFSLEAATWDEEPRRVQLANDLVRAIAQEVPLTPSMDALDFGCGTGLVTLPLSSVVKRITGVDSAQGMLDKLCAKAQSCKLDNIATRLIDLERGDVLGGLFDVVVTTMTLHHMRDTQALLKQFASVLRPGGYLCIADLDAESGEFHGNNDGVYHFGFDRAALKMSLTAAGFTSITDKTAAEVIKPGADGQMKPFPIFLINGMLSSLDDLM